MTDAAAPTFSDKRLVVTRLEAQLHATSRSLRPHEHAALSFRLGLAYAELPTGDPDANLRQALAYYERAAAIFDPRFDPVEHARVLNMAGAAHLRLGARERAAQLFDQSARLLEDRSRADERAAVFNNLGVALAEAGDIAGAVAACDAALALFDGASPESRRGRSAALHTRGAAHAAGSGEQAQVAALADFEAAAAAASAEEAPYHHGLVHHSLGVSCMTLAALSPDGAAGLLARAIGAFVESLQVFTLASFPYQHALARHNLGRALAGVGGIQNLRRALACFEDAVAVLDPRLHAPAWKHAFASLEQTEADATDLVGTPLSRPEHFAALLASVEEPERRALLRERLGRYLAMAPQPRSHAFEEFALAVAGLDDDGPFRVMSSELDVLMELPTEGLEAALRAMVDVHRRLGDDQADADSALDRAVSDALVGPQRVWARDFLYSIEWVRP